jgi:hypothetical protein
MPRRTRGKLIGRKNEKIERAALARELRALQKELHAAWRQQASSNQATNEQTDWLDTYEDYEP